MGTEDISKKPILEEILRRWSQSCGEIPIQCVGMSRNELPTIMNDLGYHYGAEIGVLRGAYSRLICDSIPDVKLVCVDPWVPYREWAKGNLHNMNKMEGHFIRAKRRLRGFHVTFIREMSMDAVRNIPDKSLDFVYIDGLHEFDPVMLDLLHWGDKVRSGGMIAGHDYSEPAWHNGVMLAVDTYTKAHNIDKWYITDEKDKSYFWVKP